MQAGMRMKTTPFLPDTTIGIIGGGQLGRMMALAGRAMGYRFNVLDPDEAAPARAIADTFFQGSFADTEGLMRLAEASDVLVYEFEHIDTHSLEMVARIKPLPQGVTILRLAQHRALEKEGLSAHGFPVAPYTLLRTPDDLIPALKKLGLPVVVKTTSGGYDGKGQWHIQTEGEIQIVRRAIEAVYANFRANRDDREPDRPTSITKEEMPLYDESLDRVDRNGRAVRGFLSSDLVRVPLIVERFIPYEKELSVIVSRRADGESQVFPVAENHHVDGILRRSIVPARVPDAVQKKAAVLATAIADAFGVVGLLAVELFYLPDGTLLINELAPRPHNSGHYTLDAVSTSQFEQFLRAVLHLPLGDVRLFTPVVMVNILGEHLPSLLKVLPTLDARVKVHLYGKKEARAGRKMGHLNILAESVEEALEVARTIGIS
ncbi:MAG: Phosphoribosylaminoimidazole carboxylase ATPase subunit [Candidatus Carbobacillus altaicus]|uniref:N5-carboxyaminoimidazole ribonucleotide synthase n=1 Tax=Candidatus Carbonibacillus altaicus TaxID=2163959 RepID=A0A2R6XZK3_9BACL|nr:MAG: Phosphoribosylaminoimidazole carboxylase ATPase subunit [Candidatus Carbobacillus altaicus]